MSLRFPYIAGFLLLSSVGCEQVNPALRPDLQLIEELGLSRTDRVHTVRLTVADQELAYPDSLLVQEGDYIQFVSDDWFLHEVRFDSTAMSKHAWEFMVLNNQASSPPLLQHGARFLISFVDASPGVYPFLLEGNREPGSGVIVVASPSGIP